MPWHYVEKEFRDVADDVEGVNIHYAWTPVGKAPDWQNQRVTRFMPVIAGPSQEGETPPMTGGLRLRKRLLRLPRVIVDPDSGTETDRYLLHHYFEIFQDGHRQYSELYTEEIATGGVESRG